ncbi:MAG: hypothetical protein COA79_24980 [Planctomycetota bacterium]|nr:MAG: hypothetical protein COA79_24980 [Planctomycetota bacterium]
MVETQGRKLGGFLLNKLLGQGAMGAVYRGKQLSLDRDVAVKVILPTYSDNPEYIRRFEREAKLVAQLTHQNITQIYEFGTFDGFYLIVMEFVEGTSLKALHANLNKIEPYAVCEMLSHIASGLAAGASKNIVHRDIKPENIQISKQGVCKILDYGLAKDESGNSQMTMAGGILGTPSFMSPEQCKGDKVTYHADIYGLGTSAYYLLTGEVPYKADSQLAVLNMHCNAPIPDPRTKNPDIPESLSNFVMKLMAKKPTDRCESADQVVTDLQDILYSISDRVPLSKMAPKWNWDDLITQVDSDGTSLLDDLGGNNDQTIVSGSKGGMTEQLPGYNDETIVSGAHTGMLTRGQTQQYDQTLQPNATVSNATAMDATLQPTSGLTQTFDTNINAQTMVDQAASKNKIIFGVMGIALIAIVLIVVFMGGTDWKQLDAKFATIRTEIKNNEFGSIERAKDLIKNNAGYPQFAIVENEIKTWEKLKGSYIEYNEIVSLVEDENYIEARKKSEDFKDKFGISNPYWKNKLLDSQKRWKGFAKASEKKKSAVKHAQNSQYKEALLKLEEIKALHPDYQREKIKQLIVNYRLESSRKKIGVMGQDVERVSVLVKNKQFVQAGKILQTIVLNGNSDEKKTSQNNINTVVAKLQSDIGDRLEKGQLGGYDEMLSIVKGLNPKGSKWLVQFEKTKVSLQNKYKTYISTADSLLKQNKFNEAFKHHNDARNIQKPAEDEAKHIEFMVNYAIVRGDALLKDKDYAKAYTVFENGLKFNKSHKTLLERKKLTNEKLLANQKSSKEQKAIDDAISKGKSLEKNNKDLKGALINYENALSLAPNDKSTKEAVRRVGVMIKFSSLEKFLNQKDDKTELVSSGIKDLAKIVKGNEIKQLNSLKVKLTTKKKTILSSKINKAIKQKSFIEIQDYLLSLKTIDKGGKLFNTSAKKAVALFESEAAVLIKNNRYTKASDLLNKANKILPSTSLNKQIAAISKLKEEEKNRNARIAKIDKLVKEATVLFENGKHEASLKIAEDAYKVDSKNADTLKIRSKAGYEYYAGLGFAAHKEAKFEIAKTNLKKALTYDANRPKAKSLLAILLRPKAELILINTLAKAKLQQQAWAISLGLPIEKKFKVDGVDFVFILIPAGKFEMGADEGGDSDEKPARIITISNCFYMMKNEVTNEQYGVFNPGEKSFSRGKRKPILGIVYNKLLQFSKFLSAELNGKVRAPTEAEWEFACRSGNTGDYCFGNKLPLLKEYAHFKDSASGIQDVMTLKPNAYGVYDLHGNAFEYCRDFYSKKAYKKVNLTNPWFKDRAKTKVIRGGSYRSTPANLRNGNRSNRPAAFREQLTEVGLRIILEIKK